MSQVMMPYQYIVLRCVPRVEREEFVNVGVVLHCDEADALLSASHIDPARLRALDPAIDIDAVSDGLRFVAAVCRGDSDAGGIAATDLGVRFGFLKAPRSTVIQPGPVHSGITTDPPAELERLLEAQVR